MVSYKRGDLICWDAGFRHGSKPPPPVATALVTDTDRASRRRRLGLPVGRVEPVRVAVPICMVPKMCVEQDVLRKRRLLFESGGSANHDAWSEQLFERHPDPHARPRAYKAPDTAECMGVQRSGGPRR